MYKKKRPTHLPNFSRQGRERQTEIIKCGLTVILVISHLGFHSFSKLCPCQLGLDGCLWFTVIKLEGPGGKKNITKHETFFSENTLKKQDD